MNAATGTDYHFSLRDGLLGLQMLFVAFGALVLVPLPTGLNPIVTLFTPSTGTLQFKGIGLAGVVGVLLNLVLPCRQKEPDEVTAPPAPH